MTKPKPKKQTVEEWAREQARALIADMESCKKSNCDNPYFHIEELLIFAYRKGQKATVYSYWAGFLGGENWREKYFALKKRKKNK